MEELHLQKGISLEDIYKIAYECKWDKKKIKNKIGQFEFKNFQMVKLEEKFECPICFEMVDSENVFSLGCNHYTCLDCFKDHAKFIGFNYNEIPYCPQCNESVISIK